MMKLPRWYSLVGIVVPLSAIFLVLLILQAGLWFPSWWFAMAAVLWWVVQSTQLLVLGSGIWFCWVCPYLEATDPSAELRLNAEQRLRGLRLWIAMPAIGLVLVGAVMALLLPLEWRINEGTWEWDMWQWVGVVLLALAVPVGFFCRWWARKVTALYHQTMRANVCINCGYDLRGSPGPNCPECGQHISTETDPSVPL